MTAGEDRCAPFRRGNLFARDDRPRDYPHPTNNRTPAEVTAGAKSALEAWGQEPGLIMGPGCEFPYKVPVENIKAFKESVERYGKRQ